MSISTAEPDSNKRLLSKLDTVAVKSLFLSLTLAISLYPARAGIILADFEPEMPKNTASSLDSVLVGGPVIHKTAPAHTVRKVTVTAYTSNPRMKNVVDVWMSSKKDAYRFGSRTMEIHILN